MCCWNIYWYLKLKLCWKLNFNLTASPPFQSKLDDDPLLINDENLARFVNASFLEDEILPSNNIWHFATPTSAGSYMNCLLTRNTKFSTISNYSQCKNVFLGQIYSDCVKKDIWSKLSSKINCSIIYFDGFIPDEDKTKIKGMS